MNKGLERGKKQQIGEFKKAGVGGKADLIYDIRPGNWNPHMSQLLNSGLLKISSELAQ